MALELMRERVVARDRAPARGRRARRGARRATRPGRAAGPACARSGSAPRRRSSSSTLDDPAAARAGARDRPRRRAAPALVATTATAAEPLLCAVDRRRRTRPRRGRARRPLGARRARGQRGPPAPPRAARRRRLAAAERSTRRAARSRPTSLADGDAPEVASHRDLGAFTLLLSLQDDEALRALQRQPAGADRAHRGRVRRRAAALAGGLHRAERPVGAGRAPALLPPPHAALPDPQDRGADRPRPLRAPRPDRALAGAAGAGSWSDEGRRVPRGRRDDRAGDRPRPGRVRGGRRAAAARPRRARAPRPSRPTTARGKARAARRRRPRRDGARRRARGRATCSSTPPATGSTSTRCAACLEAGCHYLDLGGLYWMTGAPARADRRVRAAGPAGAAGDRLGARQDEPDGRAVAAAASWAARVGRACDVSRGGPRPRSARRLQRPLRAADPARRADDGRRSSLRDGEPVEVEPLADGGVVDFGDPIGERRDDPTPCTPSCGPSATASAAARRASGSRLRPDLLERLRELVGCLRRGGGARPRREALPPSAQTVSVHLVEAAGGGRTVACAAVTRADRGVGAGRRHRLHGGAGRGGGAPARARRDRRRAGRCRPSAASTRTRCSPSSSSAGCRFEVDGQRGGRTREGRRRHARSSPTSTGSR